MAKEKQFEVGYGKPPKETRFVKGHSGNKNGRPKGVRNLDTIVTKVGRQRVNVTGKRGTRSMVMLEAMIYQLSSQALSGNLKAIQAYLQLYRLSTESEQAAALSPILHERDAAVMQGILKRAREIDEPTSAQTSSTETTEASKEEQ